MADIVYIAVAIVALAMLLFMFGAAKVAADADRQSERLWRLISSRRLPSRNS